MTRLTDETGNRYGRLVVIERGHNSDAVVVRVRLREQALNRRLRARDVAGRFA